MNKRTIFSKCSGAFAVIIVAGSMLLAAPTEVDLATGGQACFEVVTAEGASPRVRAAAQELVEQLGHIVGTTFILSDGDGESGLAVGQLGDFPQLDTGVVFEPDAPSGREDYLLRTHSQGAYIIGATELAVEHAVWDFLYRLGYRQYFPGDHWEIVPAKPDLKVALDTVQRPSFNCRETPSAVSTKPDIFGDVEDHRNWMRRNRISDGWKTEGGHIYGFIIRARQDIFDAHPEYLALVDGVRTGQKFCVSNPDLRQLVVEYALERLATKPEADAISMEPSDGGGFCECENCAQIGTVTDQVVLLANQVAEAVVAEYPGKYVSILAYNFHTAPPNLQLHTNIVVTVCAGQLTGHWKPHELFDAWAAKGANSTGVGFGVYEYYMNIVENRYLPGAPRASDISYLHDTITDFHRRGARRLRSGAAYSNGSLSLGLYLASRMLWDIEEAERIEELYSDFLLKCFGAAAAPMDTFFRQLYRFPGDPPRLPISEDRIARMYRALDTAWPLADSDPIRRRIQDLILYTRYAELRLKADRAPAEERLERFGDAMRHVWRMRSLMMVNTYGLFRYLPSEYPEETYSWSVPAATNPWKEGDPHTEFEIADILANGIADTAIGVYETASYSDNLVPAKPLKLTDKALGSYRFGLPPSGIQNFYTWFDHPGSIALDITGGYIWPKRADNVHITLYAVGAGENDSDLIVDTDNSVPPDQEEYRVWLSTALRGLHRIEVEGGPAGTKVEPATEGMAFTVQAGPQTCFNRRHMWDGWFYVPKGTERISFFVDEPPSADIYTEDGTHVYSFRQAWIDPDGVPRPAVTRAGFHTIDVPAGSDRAPWRLNRVKGEFFLLNVPPYLARRPSELLLPLEVVTTEWTGNEDDLWNNPNNWTEGVPQDGHAVTIPAGTTIVVTESSANLSSLSIENGGTLEIQGWDSVVSATDMIVDGTITHSPNTTESAGEEGDWIPEHRVLLSGSNLTITATGKIDANYKGYRAQCGPGSPAPYGGARGGAGHATDGGYSRGDNYARGGFSYGDPAAPTQPGSGGGTHANSREGGGAVRITLTGRLDLQGAIQADGQEGIYSHGAGGSGGSIWITTHTITGDGTGTISASGGRGRTYAGGGAGGRIAIEYDPVAQAGLKESCPVVFQADSGANDLEEFLQATFGTLHLPDDLWLNETLDARFNSITVMVENKFSWAPDSLELDGAKIGFVPGFNLDIDGDLVLRNGAVLHLTAAPVENPLTEDGLKVQIGGSMTIGSQCWIHPYADPTNGATVAFVISGDMEIAALGGIDANYKGYNFGYGPGVAPTEHGGAGYGGRGAMGPYGRLWGTVYGDPSAPRQPGSGRAEISSFRASPGGGAIRLEVGGHLELNGQLLANGATDGQTHCSGGSGGGIHVICQTFGGGSSGLATVKGGAGHGSGGAGGGGRIAIIYDPEKQRDAPLPAVSFTAYAPPSAKPPGYNATFEARMGTLYLPDTLWVTEVIDGNRFDSVRLVIPGFTEWSPANLAITDSILELPAGFHLDVVGDMEIGPGARLVIAAAATNAPNERWGASLDVGANLRIAAGGWLSPQSHATNGAVVRLRVAGDFEAAQGGGIDARGLGYHPDFGPGLGGDAKSGGSYGGLGAGPKPGAAYGNPAWPVHPGSPGGPHYSYPKADNLSDSGFGGGAIMLQVGGRALIDGLLDVGTKQAAYQTAAAAEGAGGSGGSILLMAARGVSGQGTLDASGGLGMRNASGGGGRIAVWPLLPLAVQDSLLRGDVVSGVPQDYYQPFEGDLLVESPIGEHANELSGEPGTASFYLRQGTIMMLR